MSFSETFHEILDKITHWFKSIGEDVMDFIEPLAKEIAQNGGVVLLLAAEQAVLAAERAGGSGSDKFNAARKAIENELKDKGFPIVINAVNGAIESAVAKMNAGK